MSETTIDDLVSKILAQKLKKTGVDPTNNASEREIRPAVLMRKISYCNRSEQGARNQELLMSMARTAQKRGQNFTQIAAQYLTENIN